MEWELNFALTSLIFIYFLLLRRPAAAPTNKDTNLALMHELSFSYPCPGFPFTGMEPLQYFANLKNGLICFQSNVPSPHFHPQVWITSQISWLPMLTIISLRRGPLSLPLLPELVTTEAWNSSAASGVGTIGRISLLGGTRQQYFLPPRCFLSLSPSILWCCSVLTPTLLWRSCPLLPTYSYSERALSGHGGALETKVANKGGGLNLPPSCCRARDEGSYPRVHSYKAINGKKWRFLFIGFFFNLKNENQYESVFSILLNSEIAEDNHQAMFSAVSPEGEVTVKREAHQPLHIDPFRLLENKATAAVISAKEGGVCGVGQKSFMNQFSK